MTNYRLATGSFRIFTSYILSQPIIIMYLTSPRILMVCFTALTVCVSACAQTKKGTTKANATATPGEKAILQQTTSQRTNPGRQETEPTVEYRFVIVWNSKKEPAKFFWRGENSWQVCNITKVKNFSVLKVKDNGVPQPMNYENNDPGNITYQYGDTLELYPAAMGKHPVPNEIPKDKKNIIYYKETGGEWMALPVEKITKLPTISMP